MYTVCLWFLIHRELLSGKTQSRRKRLQILLMGTFTIPSKTKMELMSFGIRIGVDIISINRDLNIV